MAFFDFLKREAKDLGDAAEKAKDRFDQELTKREQELEMTPSEKIAAIQRQAEGSDAKVNAILDKAGAQGAMADGVAEVGSLPNVTHIVLPDGQVKSGEQAPAAIVDDDGTVHQVPLVSAPTAEDLQKPAATRAPAPVQPAPVVQAPPAQQPAPTPAPPVSGPSPEEIAAMEGTAPATAQAPVVTPQAEDLPSPPAAPVVPSTADPVAAVTETPTPSNPELSKTPAQLKYERARAAANDLLDELREELKDDGDI